jgi:ribokinase
VYNYDILPMQNAGEFHERCCVWQHQYGSDHLCITPAPPRRDSVWNNLLDCSIVAGGKGANQAAAAARLGAETDLVGRIGNDVFGRELLPLLEIEGINIYGVRFDAENATGLAVISVDESAENTVVVVSGANMALDQTDVDRCVPLLDKARVLMLTLETPIEANMAVARAAKERGVTVILDPAPAMNIPMAFHELIDIITPNESETKVLTGVWPATQDEAEKATKEILERGAKIAIIKMGSRGAYYANTLGGRFVKPFPVVARDTVAAGDAFNGGLAAALAEGLGLAEAVQWGCAAGAIAVTRPGAMPSMPHRDELEKLLAG